LTTEIETAFSVRYQLRRRDLAIYAIQTEHFLLYVQASVILELFKHLRYRKKNRSKVPEVVDAAVIF
jgi:uncharacterized membrane protein (DUF373 family)